MEGSTYGVEVWANWQVTSWWRLSPGFRSLHKRLRFSDGASQLLGVEQAGNDPTSQALAQVVHGLRALDRGRDAALCRKAAVAGRARSYEELGARVAWRASDSLEFSISGFNLLDERHDEYAVPTGRELRRSIYAEARWTFLKSASLGLGSHEFRLDGIHARRPHP